MSRLPNFVVEDNIRFYFYDQISRPGTLLGEKRTAVTKEACPAKAWCFTYAMESVFRMIIINLRLRAGGEAGDSRPYASGNTHVPETSEELNPSGVGPHQNMKFFTRCGTLEDSSPSLAKARTLQLAGASFRDANTEYNCSYAHGPTYRTVESQIPWF